MITLKSLVLVAPFEESTRKTLLEKIDKKELTDNQIVQITFLCWDMITRLHQTELQLRISDMIRESSEGKKNYSKNDYQELETKLVFNLSNQLNQAGAEADLEEVRKQLTQITKKENPEVTQNNVV